MKTISEIKDIREKTKAKLDLADGSAKYRVVVGLATCGIAAGARPVLAAMQEEVAALKLGNVVVTQTGCIGVCRLEPIVEVYEAGAERVTYVKVTPELAKQIAAEHLAKGNVLTDSAIGAHM